MSDLAGLEEIAEQTSVRVNGRTGFGWSLPPHIEKATAAREAKRVLPPCDAATRLDDDEKGLTNGYTPGGRIQSTTIVSAAEITTYTELMTAIQARVAALGIRLLDFDDLAGFAAGLSGKIFGASQIKRLGPEKLFDALRAAGLRLRVEVDPVQAAKMQARIQQNYNPRKSAQSRQANNHWRDGCPSEKMIAGVLNYLANKKDGLARLNAAVRDARSNRARRGHATRRQMRECDTGDFVRDEAATAA